MGSLTHAQSIKNYDFWISDLKFDPSWCICLGFLSSQPKTYIRLILRVVIHGYRDQEFNFLCEKLLYLYAIGFCNQVFLDLHCWWSEELCNQQQLFKLLKLFMYWDLCKGIRHGLEIYASKKRRLLQDQIQLGIGAKVQL